MNESVCMMNNDVALTFWHQ